MLIRFPGILIGSSPLYWKVLHMPDERARWAWIGISILLTAAILLLTEEIGYRLEQRNGRARGEPDEK
jgi:hypothetical protein